MSSIDLIDDLDQLLSEVGDDTSKTKKPSRRKAAGGKAVPPSDLKIDAFSKQHGFCGKRVKIIIDRSQNVQDPTSVFLRLNDYTAFVERGVPVELPIEVVREVLDHAVHTSFSQPTEGVMVPHDSPRLPYQRVS